MITINSKYIVELFGTCALTLLVLVGLSTHNPFTTPVLAALTLGLLVYTVGHVSGAHFNPAVTLGAWSIGKIAKADVGPYIVAQLLGAGLARIVAAGLVSDLVLILPTMDRLSNTPMVALAEGLGALLFGFGIASVVYGKTARDLHGVVIGVSLLLGIMIASTVSNGVLNPAVAFGIGSLNFAYSVGPIIGMTLGMWGYKKLCSEM